MGESNFIFAYGSLVNKKDLQSYLGRSPSEIQCNLRDYRRCWNIAMDNQIDLPGYKYYVYKDTGERPKSFITFLNIRPCEGERITGILFQIFDEELRRLDKRERNYRRIDVTNSIDIPVKGKVWTYIGLDEAEKRYQQGFEQGNAIISQDYYKEIVNAYKELGEEAKSNYDNTTDDPEVPILNLEEIDKRSDRVQG
jgi:cation transport regulator ChaC